MAKPRLYEGVSDEYIEQTHQLIDVLFPPNPLARTDIPPANSEDPCPCTDLDYGKCPKYKTCVEPCTLFNMYTNTCKISKYRKLIRAEGLYTQP